MAHLFKYLYCRFIIFVEIIIAIRAEYIYFSVTKIRALYMVAGGGENQAFFTQITPTLLVRYLCSLFKRRKTLARLGDYKVL